MKIFETPVLNVKEFSRVSILTASGTDTPTEKQGTTALAAAGTKINSRIAEIKATNPNASVVDFVFN